MINYGALNWYPLKVSVKCFVNLTVIIKYIKISNMYKHGVVKKQILCKYYKNIMYTKI